MMFRTTLRSTLVATALVLALGGIAQAAELITPPLRFNDNANAELHCRVVNQSGSVTKNLTIDIKDETGVVVVTTGATTIAPGAAVELVTTSTGIRYCRILISGLKGNARGALAVFDLGLEADTAAVHAQ